MPRSPFPTPRPSPSQGSQVHLDFYNLHRDPAQFPDPLVFKHERWLDKDSAEAKARHPNAWQGFGSGARMCLGYKLATMELIQVRRG